LANKIAEMQKIDENILKLAGMKQRFNDCCSKWADAVNEWERVRMIVGKEGKELCSPDIRKECSPISAKQVLEKSSNVPEKNTSPGGTSPNGNTEKNTFLKKNSPLTNSPSNSSKSNTQGALNADFNQAQSAIRSSLPQSSQDQVNALSDGDVWLDSFHTMKQNSKRTVNLIGTPISHEGFQAIVEKNLALIVKEKMLMMEQNCKKVSEELERTKDMSAVSAGEKLGDSNFEHSRNILGKFETKAIAGEVNTGLHTGFLGTRFQNSEAWKKAAEAKLKYELHYQKLVQTRV
jgi:hypothetical protein